MWILYCFVAEPQRNILRGDWLVVLFCPSTHQRLCHTWGIINRCKALPSGIERLKGGLEKARVCRSRQTSASRLVGNYFSLESSCVFIGWLEIDDSCSICSASPTTQKDFSYLGHSKMPFAFFWEGCLFDGKRRAWF